MTDEEIILKHDASCRPRARMELAVVNALLTRLYHDGFVPVVMDYELEEGETVKDALFNLDDAYLEIYRPGEDKRLGWVYFVFGNDGYDVISDYTVNIEPLLKEALDLSKKLENGLA